MDNSTAETARMTKHYRAEYADIIGRKVLDVRAMYPEEMEMFMWSGGLGSVLIMDNGGLVIPMSDAEGNDTGHLMVQAGH
jgi:hypothetical protein